MFSLELHKLNKNFIKLNRLVDFGHEFFCEQIKGTLSRYVKGVGMNILQSAGGNGGGNMNPTAIWNRPSSCLSSCQQMQAGSCNMQQLQHLVQNGQLTQLIYMFGSKV